ncbi:MAG: hypothetical protein IPL61_17200 [Myxococcales bacterium]|nr:hypothetical protein [Myxococcales bacterium]
MQSPGLRRTSVYGGILATLMTSAACHPAAPTAPGTTAPPTPAAAVGTASDGAPTTPTAPSAGPDWMWTAGVEPAWRLPATVIDLLAVDRGRALGLIAGRRLAVIDLTTGAVTVTAADFGAGAPSRLVRAGGQVLAYGQAAKAAAAWTIDPASLAVAPLALPEPAAGAAAGGTFTMAVSPDGARVLTCSADRWPTLRDATTLAAVKVFTGLDACDRPRFVDASHAYVERVGRTGPARLGDLVAGTVTAVPTGGPLWVRGPGGLGLSVAGSKVAITGADGAVRARYTTALGGPIWLDDGSAVVAAARRHLTVLAAAAGTAARTIELPAAVLRLHPIPASTRVLIQMGTYRLGVVDTATGTVVTASGTNLGGVSTIAALEGAVISAADRLRVWRRGQVAATGATAAVEALDVAPGRDALYATFDGVFAADLTTAAPTPIDEQASSSSVDRHGDDLAWDRDDRVMIQHGASRPTTWLRRPDALFLLDLDLATGRLAFNDDHAFYVVRPDRRALFGFHAYDCEDPLYLWLERGRERAVSYDGVTAHLYDTAKQRGLGGLELVDDNIEAVAFIPGSDALALVGASIYLWDPTTHAVVAWPLPDEVVGFDATAIGVDPSGAEVAVGFADGAVLWARLAEVRARATPVGADVATQHKPAALQCGKPMIKDYADVELGPDPGYDDERDDDDE